MEKLELKKLTRSELLELLLDRSKEVEHLRISLDEAHQRIAEYEEKMQQVGSLNHVIERLNQIVEQTEEGIRHEE